MPSDLPDPKPPINHSYMQNQLAIDAVPLNKNVVYNFKFAAFPFDWPNQKTTSLSTSNSTSVFSFAITKSPTETPVPSRNTRPLRRRSDAAHRTSSINFKGKWMEIYDSRKGMIF